MPKCTVYIRVENEKKWNLISNKSEWLNAILISWSSKDLENAILNPYSKLEKRVMKLEKLIEMKKEAKE